MTNHWVIFGLRRIAALAVVLFALGSLTFMMVRLVPGDPVRVVAGVDATPEQMEVVRVRLGLDKPIQVQFVEYWSGLFRGDLSESVYTGRPVTEILLQVTPHSLQLATVSLLAVLVLSIPIGLFAAEWTREGRHGRFEAAFTGVTSILGGIPEYLAATFLVFVFAVTLSWLPVAGAAGWHSLVLPSLAVSLRPIATLARIVRVETLNVWGMDYMRTARSKRLPLRIIYGRHALPNVLTTTLTIGGLLFASLVGGAVIVENVFARPGLGTVLVRSLLERDFPVTQGAVLVLGMMVILVNTVVDVVLAILDPRSITRQA